MIIILIIRIFLWMCIAISATFKLEAFIAEMFALSAERDIHVLLQCLVFGFSLISDTLVRQGQKRVGCNYYIMIVTGSAIFVTLNTFFAVDCIDDPFKMAPFYK